MKPYHRKPYTQIRDSLITLFLLGIFAGLAFFGLAFLAWAVRVFLEAI